MTEQQRQRLMRARDALYDVQVQALTARELLVSDEPDDPAPEIPPDLARQADALTETLGEVVRGIGAVLGEPEE